MTTVLLYSDRPVLVSGLEAILRDTGGYQLLPPCRTTAGLLAQLVSTTPDIVLVDLTPQVTFAMLTETRRAIRHGKMILWVNTISPELAFQAMGLGVQGILRKTLSNELHIKCLERVRAGELWFEKALTGNLLCSDRVPLSPREGQLIALLSQGLKNKEIAAELSIGEGTVKVYLSELFEKVGVKDRFELALYGLKNLTGHRPTDENGQDAADSLLPNLCATLWEGPRKVYEAPKPVVLPSHDRIIRH